MIVSQCGERTCAILVCRAVAWSTLSVLMSVSSVVAQGTDDALSASVERQFDDALEELRATRGRSDEDSCIAAILIAAEDGEVRRKFIEKFMNAEYVYRGVRCLGMLGIPEYEEVLFDFDCRPDIICLLDPQFVAIVNVVEGRVVGIVDPYQRKRGCDASGSADVSVDVSGTTVTLIAAVRAEVECDYVGTVLRASADLEVSKDLSELTPCVDVTASGSGLTLEGRLCLRGSEVCLEDWKLKVKYRGNSYTVVSGAPPVCVGL